MSSGFIAGTPVWTDRGLVPIEQLRLGDHVLSRADDAGEAACRKVIRTLSCQGKTIMSLRYCLPPPDDGEICHLHLTDDHQLWVKGAGWIRAYLLEGGEEFELPDGRTAYALEIVPVYKTDRPGIAWMPEYSHSVDGFEIDFSDGKAWWLDDADQRNFGTSLGVLSATVYDIDVEDANNYYVGALGLRVHSADATEGR
jgi:hypothetical protein